MDVSYNLCMSAAEVFVVVMCIGSLRRYFDIFSALWTLDHEPVLSKNSLETATLKNPGALALSTPSPNPRNIQRYKLRVPNSSSALYSAVFSPTIGPSSSSFFAFSFHDSLLAFHLISPPFFFL